MKFLDFFAGIGLFRLGLEMAGMECAGHCEIDKYANENYERLHNPKEGEWFEKDITKVSSEELPNVPLWVGGFPCQDCSVAGERRGIYGERSGLFFEFVRLLAERSPDNRPRWLILENVKGLLSSGESRDFGVVLYELAALGYSIEYAVLNSKDFGAPQNRERVFIICDITGRSTGKIFPLGNTNQSALEQIIGGPQGSRVYTTDGLAPTITSGSGGLGSKTGLFLVDLTEKEPIITDTARTLISRYNKGISSRNAEISGVLYSELPRAVLNPTRENTRQNGRRIKDEDEEMFTLTTMDVHGILMNSRIRKLTPRECFRLQGVPDSFFDKVEGHSSDSQLYKQIGNAVTVPVVYEIGKKIMEICEEEKINSIDV